VFDKSSGGFTYIVQNGASVIDYLLMSEGLINSILYTDLENIVELKHCMIVCKFNGRKVLTTCFQNQGDVKGSSNNRYR
jgi:hypothetical protein